MRSNSKIVLLTAFRIFFRNNCLKSVMMVSYITFDNGRAMTKVVVLYGNDGSVQ